MAQFYPGLCRLLVWRGYCMKHCKLDLFGLLYVTEEPFKIRIDVKHADEVSDLIGIYENT